MYTIYGTVSFKVSLCAGVFMTTVLTTSRQATTKGTGTGTTTIYEFLQNYFYMNGFFVGKFLIKHQNVSSGDQNFFMDSAYYHIYAKDVKIGIYNRILLII